MGGAGASLRDARPERVVGPLNASLVLGSADCLWEDLEALEELVGGPWTGKVYAVNQAGCAYPGRVDYWVSLHQENMEDWMARRRANGYEDAGEVWGGIWRTKRKDIDLLWVDKILPVRLVGSSGFHAVEISLHLGEHPTVLAGMPMDRRPHFHSQTDWKSAGSSCMSAMPVSAGPQASSRMTLCSLLIVCPRCSH